MIERQPFEGNCTIAKSTAGFLDDGFWINPDWKASYRLSCPIGPFGTFQEAVAEAKDLRLWINYRKQAA